jgi:hypothetical protein
MASLGLLISLMTGCGGPSSDQDAPEQSHHFEGHVADLGEFLDPQAVSALEQQLADYERRSGITFMLYTAPSGVLESLSKRLERRVNLSPRGLNATAFILINRQERQAKIEVNHGLEWQITDSVSNQVLDQMLAAFKADRYAEGLQQAFASLYEPVKALPFQVAYPSLEAAIEADGKALGEIVAFSAVLQRPAPPLTGGSQFDSNFFLSVQTPSGQVARVYFSRYMSELLPVFSVNGQPVNIHARIRTLSPDLTLELMAANL